MDPNETLRRLRVQLTKWRRAASQHGLAITALSPGEADDIAEYAAELDDWLSKGGFPPDAWQPPLVKGGTPTSEAARRRLELVFDRALGDDEELDKRFSTDETARRERGRLARLLAQAVLDELDVEHRQMIAAMVSTASEGFLRNLREELMKSPRRIEVPPGFTFEGWERLNEQRRGRHEGDGSAT